MKIDKAGTYTLTYTATDDCGNKTTETKAVMVEEVPKTFLTANGRLHINVPDPKTFRANNEIVAEWNGLGYGNDYVWDSTQNVLWKDYIDDIQVVNIDSPIKPKSTANWFNKCVNMESIGSGPFYLDMSECTNIKYMFSECRSLRLETVGIPSWDTSKVTDMRSVFYEVPMDSELNLSKWNVSNVTTMYYMFYGSGFTTLDLTGWNTSKVESFTNMFSNMANLTTIKASDTFTINGFGGNMFTNDTQIEGGKGTTYQSGSSTYAHIDEGETNPGYFTEG